jgi:predicted phosphodiesterase
MRTLLISPTPYSALPYSLRTSQTTHKWYTIPHLQESRENTLKMIYNSLRSGENIIVCAPSKKWVYTKEGTKFLEALLEIAKTRRYQIQWISHLKENEKKQPSRFGLTEITTVETALSLNKKRCIISKDVSEYDTLVFVGDIHGYLQEAKKLTEPFINQNAFYVFLGDYVSKGPNGLATIQWIEKEFLSQDNTIALTGNHELHLEDWSGNINVKKDDFNNTWPDDDKDVKPPKKSLVRKFLSQIHEAVDLTWKGERFTVSHGGLITPPKKNKCYAAAHFIFGPGSPFDDIDELWQNSEKTHEYNSIQVHGHRNPNFRGTNSVPTSWNLEGVESFQEVRGVALTHTHKIHSQLLSVPFGKNLQKTPFEMPKT